MTDELELQSKPVIYEVEDLVALSRLVPMSPIRLFRFAAAAIVILLMFTTVGEAWQLTGFVDWPALLACLFIAGMILLLTSRRFRARFWLKIARRSPIYAAHVYGITPAGLRISYSKSISEVQWAAFPRVTRADERLYLFMSARQAFIIPRRAFDSDAEFERFTDAAEERWRSASTGT